jgi:hypothetical protein
MRVNLLVCAAIVAAAMPGAALADDPHDPAMRDSAARARDREAIRQLNLQQLAMVRERDARYAEGWRTARENRNSSAREDYARDRDRYERDMAAWRRAVVACRRGDYSACDD